MHPDKPLLINQNGLLRMLANTAYRSFQKVPRKRAKVVMSVLFGIAKKKGYREEVEFKSYFMSPNRNKQTDDKYLKSFSSFLSSEDLQIAMSYASDAA